MNDHELTGPDIDTTRDATVETLIRHFAQDALTLEEFEQRVDRAHRARTRPELTALVADLPAPLPDETPAPVADTAAVTGPRVPVVMAVMGGNVRSGRWRPGERVVAVAVMGGVELDFRDALMAPGETHVVVLALMGGVTLVVPPDLEVHTSGLPLMGSFEHVDTRADARAGDAGAGSGGSAGRVLQVSGVALMGGVEIKVKDRGTERAP